MLIYWQVIKFNFQFFLTYPLSAFSLIISKALQLAFLVLFWGLIAESSETKFDTRNLAAYFLIANGVSTLVMSYSNFLGKKLRHLIRDGDINNYLIKPINLVPYFYAHIVGRYAINFLIAIALIVIGIAINPPAGIENVLVFIPFLIGAFLIGFSVNLFEGFLYFYTPEATGIKNVVRHVILVFSGKLVPIYLFPESIKKIILFSPFPGMTYSPANALTSQSIDKSIYQQILISFFWGVILMAIMLYFWRKGLKRYEGIGI